MKKTLILLEQLIEKSHYDDTQTEEYKSMCGYSESFMTHHLRILKELILEESKDAQEEK